MFRFILGLLGLAFVALCMWGIKAGMEYMGREFALGVATGGMGLLLLLILHRKVTGQDIFAPSRDAAFQKHPSRGD